MSAELMAPQNSDESINFYLPEVYKRTSTLRVLQQALTHQHYVALPRLFTNQQVSKLKEEFTRLEQFAKSRNFPMEGYATPRVMTTVGGKVIRQESTLLADLYRNEELRRMISQIAATPIYNCLDENEWMVATLLHAPGDTHGWHLDDPPIALVVFLESPPPEQGGLVEFVREWRKLCDEIGTDPEREVEETLPLYRAAGLVNVRHHQAGGAYLLRAHQSLHRVTPLCAEGARRAILNMAFELAPNLSRNGVTAKLLFDN